MLSTIIALATVAFGIAVAKATADIMAIHRAREVRALDLQAKAAARSTAGPSARRRGKRARFEVVCVVPMAAPPHTPKATQNGF